jgi:GT2 family glycosyltransferase
VSFERVVLGTGTSIGVWTEVPQSVAVRARSEPVLAVLVCHDGEQWLREALSALRGSAPRPRHVLAVDTGSRDRTAQLLAEATTGEHAVLDGVLTLDADTGFAAAVRAAVDAGVTRWGDPGRWIWLLHDDCAPEPDCLGVLLRSADLSPSAAVFGPLGLDWADPRRVIEAGLATDASGNRQSGIGPTELDWNRLRSLDRVSPDQAALDQEMFARNAFEQSTEVLAVSWAGALIEREVWAQVGGYDPALPLLRDDVDFGWRVNRAGRVALCVPAARMRHARAVSRGLRAADVLGGTSIRAADRGHGLRTVLVNCTTIGFVIGLPRLVVLSLLRTIGFILLRRLSDAGAELGAIGYVVGGGAGLLAARSARAATATADGRHVRGLLISRTMRLRNVFRVGLASWVRRRAAAEPTPTRFAAAEHRFAEPGGRIPAPDGRADVSDGRADISGGRVGVSGG